ncbi:unnamed protein product, partial [Tenebrio molitor]
ASSNVECLREINREKLPSGSSLRSSERSQTGPGPWGPHLHSSYINMCTTQAWPESHNDQSKHGIQIRRLRRLRRRSPCRRPPRLRRSTVASYAAPAYSYAAAPAVHGYAAHGYAAAPAVHAYAAPAIAKVAAPVAYAAPGAVAVKAVAPVAKVAAPVAYAAPAIAKYAAPVAAYAAAPVAHAYAAPVAHAYAAPAIAKYAAPAVAYAAPAVAKAVAPVAYAAPVAKAVVAEHYAPAHYDFGYGVNDPHTGDIKSHQESRRGDVVQGAYSLVDPDGTKRTVQYAADAHNGFNAVVHKEPIAVKAVHAVAAAPVAYAAPVAKVAAPVAYAAPAVAAVAAPAV